ncbi:MAG: 16S rRNA (guanine(966)-N(2))-methyltransferase RsmD [Deltaproteobacteria bacterium]|nr:16S rRNA (guanine(966)-N(2))-methyltransferase RsmD [Deltaproteobacteria bacterium]
MRIISGSAKGRKIVAPPGNTLSIRPTSDRAREALFSILGARVLQAHVLDLFAGTGALGLEAFSRGAGSVVFVDNNKVALEILKKNILLCHTGYSGKCEIRVIKHDLSRNLPLHRFPKQLATEFDLIFADPPYSMDYASQLLESLDSSNLLSQTGLLIVEERSNVTLPTGFSNLTLEDKRSYGEAAFWFYRTTNPAGRKKI